MVSSSNVSKFAKYNKGAIRKAVGELQLWSLRGVALHLCEEAMILQENDLIIWASVMAN